MLIPIYITTAFHLSNSPLWIPTTWKATPVLIYPWNRNIYQLCCGIWAKSASPNTKMLQLVKIEILNPSGGVLYDWLQCCPSRFWKFRHISSQIWRIQIKIFIFRGVLDPSNLKFSSTENFRFEGSKISFFGFVPSKLTA